MSTANQELLSTRKARFLRWIQRVLFMTGALALGYVAFTLWQARLYQASAKRYLESQIPAEAEHIDIRPRPVFKNGDVVGRIDIDRLGMSVAVLQGADARTLRLGAGHIPGTSLPGESGNIGIAGHRDTFFRGLKDIRQKDEIQLQTTIGLFHYEVDWVKVVGPDETTVLEPSTTDSMLTLVTCYPFYFIGPAPQRFVVRAHRHQ